MRVNNDNNNVNNINNKTLERILIISVINCLTLVVSMLTERFFLLQKQPFIGVLIKRCSENLQQIYRRTPMPKCDFNKVAKQSNFIEITLRHGSSPVILLQITRTAFLKNTFACLSWDWNWDCFWSLLCF